MNEFFQELLRKICCCHKWQVHRTVDVYEYNYSERPYETKQTLICEKCGKIKQIKL